MTFGTTRHYYRTKSEDEFSLFNLDRFCEADLQNVVFCMKLFSHFNSTRKVLSTPLLRTKISQYNKKDIIQKLIVFITK